MRPSGNPVRGKHHVVIGPSNPPTDRASKPFAPLDPMASTPLPLSLVFFHLPSRRLLSRSFPYHDCRHFSRSFPSHPPSRSPLAASFFPQSLHHVVCSWRQHGIEAATAQRWSRPPSIHSVVPRWAPERAASRRSNTRRLVESRRGGRGAVPSHRRAQAARGCAVRGRCRPFFAAGPVSVAYAVLTVVFSVDLDRLWAAFPTRSPSLPTFYFWYFLGCLKYCRHAGNVEHLLRRDTGWYGSPSDEHGSAYSGAWMGAIWWWIWRLPSMPSEKMARSTSKRACESAAQNFAIQKLLAAQICCPEWCSSVLVGQDRLRILFVVRRVLSGVVVAAK